MRRLFVKTALTTGRLPNLSEEQLGYCIEEMASRLERHEVIEARYQKVLDDYERNLTNTKPRWYGNLYLTRGISGEIVTLQGIASNFLVLKIKVKLGNQLSIPPSKITLLRLDGSKLLDISTLETCGIQPGSQLLWVWSPASTPPTVVAYRDIRILTKCLLPFLPPILIHIVTQYYNDDIPST